jgi:hypothetical protein
MSEIGDHPPGMNGPDSNSKGVATDPFPYRLVTDYGNQLMTIFVSGVWTGSVDSESPITLNTTYNPDKQVTAISFCFKMALPGQNVSATLSDGTTTYSLLLSVPR